MSKGVKFFFVFLVVFFSVIISLTIAVNEKIRPEEVSRFVKSTFKSIAPSAQVTVGKVDYSMGTMVRVYINQVEVLDKKTSLLAVKKIVCKIPLLSTVFGNGTIKINVEKPEINKKFQKYLTLNSKSYVTVEVPSFIDKNKLDLNIENFVIKNQNKEILFDRVLVKNLSLSKSMAYELVGNIKLHLGETDVEGRAQVIGEVNLNNLTDSKDINSNVMIDIKDLKTQEGRSLPRGRGKFDINWSTKTKKMSGKGKFSIDTVLDSDFEFLTDFRLLDISTLQASVVNEELPKVFKGKFFNGLDYQKSVTLIKGSINYDFINESINPFLDINLKKPIKYTHNDIPIEFTLDAKLKAKTVEAKIIKNVLGGVVTSNLKVELRNGPFDLIKSNIAKTTGNILITGVELDRSFFSNLSLEKKKQESKIQEIDFRKVVPIKNPEIYLKIDGKNNFIGKSKIDMQGSVTFSGDTLSLKNIRAKTQTGSINLNITKTKSKTEFKIKSKNIELKDFIPVLPALTPNLTGQLSFTANGFHSKDKHKYNIKMDLKDFIIDFVDLSNPVNQFLLDVGEDKVFDDGERLNSFSLVKANFVMHDQGLIIKKAKISSKKATISIKKGLIKRKDNSVITGSIRTKRQIPFKFIGHDHTLNPDIEYSKKRIKNKVK